MLRISTLPFLSMFSPCFYVREATRRTSGIIAGYLIASGILALLTGMIPQAVAAPQRIVGIEYSVWFPQLWSPPMGGQWGHPLLGNYKSDDWRVIDKHNEWLNALGVDFVAVDWTNNWNWQDKAGNFITLFRDSINLAHTDAIYKEYVRLGRMRVHHPKIAIFLGANFDYVASAQLKQDADYIYRHYVQPNPEMYFHLDGKPLIAIFLNCPAHTTSKAASWTDSRFTVRYMTGYPEVQGLSNYWSYVSRKPFPTRQTKSAPVEVTTVSMAYPATNTFWGGADGAGRANQRTFFSQWNTAVSYNPLIILLRGWNEFAPGKVNGEEYNPEYSTDLEPTQELQYEPMKAVQRAVSAWKGVALPAINAPKAAGQKRVQPRVK